MKTTRKTYNSGLYLTVIITVVNVLDLTLFFDVGFAMFVNIFSSSLAKCQ